MRMKLVCFLFSALLCSLAVRQANPASPTIIDRAGGRLLPSGPATFGGPKEIPWQAVPTSLTDVATATSHILAYCLYNSTAGTLTMTIQTKDASPLPLPLSGALAAGTSACFTFEVGLLSTGGWSIQASGSGVYYSGVWTN